VSAATGGAGRRLRVLLHAQHLSGIGHFVRTREIARALAARHQVTLLDGGRPVPGAAGDGVELLPLPRLERVGGQLLAVDPGITVGEALDRRAATLASAAARLRPDVLVVEHFPFSKWEFRDEIAGLVAAVRGARPGTCIICSVRDIPRQTSHEDCTPEAWQRVALTALHGQFDALMVHGEERLTPLAASFPAAAAIRIPVAHTGIVVARADPAPAPLADGGPYVIASVGGGEDAACLLALCARAWRRLQRDRACGGRVLVLCGGVRGVSHQVDSGTSAVRATAFDHRFPGWLAAADLSVSYAGYNSCASLLASGTPALLVPNPRMSDQSERAAVMASLGAARALEPADLTEDGMAAAMRGALGEPRRAPPVALDGAERAARFIERIAD